MSDPTDIHRWRRLDDRITTSGQPTEAQLATLAGLGVRRVVNLALTSSPRALTDEAASVAALGMAYVHIPVAFADPTEADFAAFRTAMEAARGEAVHVHCAANYRVSAFLCRYRRDVLGVDPAEARAEMERVWQPDAAWAAFLDRGRPAYTNPPFAGNVRFHGRRGHRVDREEPFEDGTTVCMGKRLRPPAPAGEDGA